MLRVKRKSLTYNTGSSDMTTNQIERLRKDSREVGHYIKRLEKKGKLDKIRVMKLKQDYINTAIEEIELSYLKAA